MHKRSLSKHHRLFFAFSMRCFSHVALNFFSIFMLFFCYWFVAASNFLKTLFSISKNINTQTAQRELPFYFAVRHFLHRIYEVAAAYDRRRTAPAVSRFTQMKIYSSPMKLHYRTNLNSLDGKLVRARGRVCTGMKNCCIANS